MATETLFALSDPDAMLTAVAVATIIMATLLQKLFLFSPHEKADSRNINRPGLEPAPIEAQWQRVTGAVQQSLARANDLQEHQAVARQKLQAAEYGLHSLLNELSAVMTPGVASPLRTKEAAPQAPTEANPFGTQARGRPRARVRRSEKSTPKSAAVA